MLHKKRVVSSHAFVYQVWLEELSPTSIYIDMGIGKIKKKHLSRHVVLFSGCSLPSSLHDSHH